MASNRDFDLERQALLESMAAQLTTVVEKVVQINDKMVDLTTEQNAVSEVAKLWNESYNRDVQEEPVAPSLTVYSQSGR